MANERLVLAAVMLIALVAFCIADKIHEKNMRAMLIRQSSHIGDDWNKPSLKGRGL